MPTTEISIIIADDHPIFRQGLRMVIERERDLKVLAEAEDGVQAVERVCQFAPQVVVLDVDMPGQDGFAAAREILAQRPAVGIVFLTMHRNESLFNAALNLGAKGYVLKDSALADIIQAIRAAARGENFISPALSTFLINRGRRSAALSEHKPDLDDLTPAERRVLKLISESKTSKEIAEVLFVSIRTIEHHRTNISQKLGLRGSHALIKFALEHKSELL